MLDIITIHVSAGTRRILFDIDSHRPIMGLSGDHQSNDYKKLVQNPVDIACYFF